MKQLNYCVVCPGQLCEDKEWSGDDYGGGYVPTGTFHCQECGLRYEFEPPDHLQKRPPQPVQVEIAWETENK